MAKKTVLLVDDEQGFLEALSDALEFEGYRVLKATSVENALLLLETKKIDLITIDIMLPPGPSLVKSIESHNAGLFLCKKVTSNYPKIEAFCISVISDESIIKEIESLGVRFLRKGETPLRTVLSMIRSRTGPTYSTGWEKHRDKIDKKD